MRLPGIQQLSLIGILVAFSAVPAVAQQSVEHKPEACERLLEAVASGKESDADAYEQIPTLIRIVEQGEQQDADLAIRALGRMQSKASPAIPALCAKLDDQDHSVRSIVIDALVAIGDESVAPLQDRLRSSSSGTRAAATAALGRLRRIELSDLDRLGKDSDPRVRAAVVSALAQSGQPGVSRLAAFLLDEELAVAVEAARALQENREDSSIAIPKLIDAFSRPHLGWAAADALAAYGIEARRAVPTIIKHYPLGHSSSFGWDDAAEEALEHIGPPDERDIPAMCDCLSHENVEARILAANSLALVGIQGRSAASALEAAAKSTVEQYLELERRHKPDVYYETDNSGRMFVAAEDLAAALWHVTRDADRFLRCLEQIVVAADDPISFSHPTPWETFSANDCASLERLLRSSNSNVQYTALDGVSDIGTPARGLKNVVLELAQSPDTDTARKAIRALAAIGPSVAEEATPVLFARLRDETIPLSQFASAVETLEIRSEQAETILEKGLHDSDRSTANACAKALCRTSRDPSRTAQRIIDLARQGRLVHRDAIEVVRSLVPAQSIVLPYLIEQVSSNDLWTCHDAMVGVGDFGPAGAPAITALYRRLDDEKNVSRRQAACAIYRVSGDASYLEQQLQSVFAGQDRADQYEAIGTIIGMGHSGAPFLHYIVTAMHAPDPLPMTRLIDALKAIGTADAIAVLEEAVNSTDWAIRSQATTVLRELRHAHETEGK